MKLCYVDETGTDGRSPVVIFVGVIADVQRVHKTRNEFEELFEDLADLPKKSIAEVKGSDLYWGNGPWRGVDGHVRHEVVARLCSWVGERKHSVALSAIDSAKFDGSDLANISGVDSWMCGAFHIALQIQKAHQSIKNNKGATFLVFDENKMKSDVLADLLFEPPTWSEDYYGRSGGRSPLDQITDSAFYARSHHVGLVQVADVLAFVLRRYAELREFGHEERYSGEADQIGRLTATVSERLLPRSSRWPTRSRSILASAYTDIAPRSLYDLG